MWRCPKCDRLFRNENQSHSCIKISEEEFLANVTESARELFDLLKDFFSNESVTYKTEAVKNCIFFIRRERFLAVKFKRTGIDIDFKLARDLNTFPVIKSIRYSKNSWWHVVRIETPGELNNEVKSWLLEAYQTLHKSS